MVLNSAKIWWIHELALSEFAVFDVTYPLENDNAASTYFLTYEKLSSQDLLTRNAVLDPVTYS